eukprot:snap_masked-scaffold_34-processed-gene-0.33-mRNA-1 protein AED:1.00 eAED:1.00 QI:0/0/0/0/1/1/2/0/96
MDSSEEIVEAMESRSFDGLNSSIFHHLPAASAVSLASPSTISSLGMLRGDRLETQTNVAITETTNKRRTKVRTIRLYLCYLLTFLLLILFDLIPLP